VGNKPAFHLGLLLALLLPVNLTIAAEVKLHIPPVYQERPSWCWAAVGEMVFKYYYVPFVHRTDYQCGIVQGSKLCVGTPDCSACDLPDGDDVTMVNMLEQYPLMATGHSGGNIALSAQTKNGTLSEAEVKHELDEGRPIIVGLSPGGFKVGDSAQHMALIVGYDESSGNLMLTVNDPFPFEDDVFLWIMNPYLKIEASGRSDGQYEIGFERFRSKLKWTQTIYRITCTGRECPSDINQVAVDSGQKDDREVIHTVLTASAGDFKHLRTGHKAVDAESRTTWLSKVTFPGAKQCLVWDKHDNGGAKWSCVFKFIDRSEADKSVKDIVTRLRNTLHDGWVATDLDEDSDSEAYTKTDKFSASKPGSHTAIDVHMIDMKKDGRVKVYLSVDNRSASE
jgi:Papain-like cysteine protease AvrRpt2